MTSLRLGLRLSVAPGDNRLARQVRERRLALGLSQRELGEQLGWPIVGRACVRLSRIETSTWTKVEIEWIHELCDAFKCSPNDLFEWEDSHTTPAIPVSK